MTMLGELYANGMGVKHDDAKAAEWYQRAADGGDREGMFALAMLRLAGRGGPVNRDEAAKLLASSAKLGEPKGRPTIWRCSILDGQTLPQDVKRAAELLRIAADAGNPEAQYALATFYKEGNGVPKTWRRRCGCCRRQRSPTMSTPKSNTPSRSITAPARHRTNPAAVALLRKAARQNSPIAQNRLAHVLLSGKGTPMDKIEGLKWHLVAKGVGKGDPVLDEAVFGPLVQRTAPKPQAAARKWLGKQMIRLDATPTAGHPVRGLILPSGRRLTS